MARRWIVSPVFGRPRTGDGSRQVSWLTAVGVGLIVLVCGAVIARAADEAVHVVDVSDEIDLGLAPYLDRAIDQAADADAAAVVVELDTPGGRMDAMLEMQSALLEAPMRTIAVVNRNAHSAGALLAIATEEIYMTPGSSMGAATPVDFITGEQADEKTLSAARSIFASTAETRGRDPRIAEAMVDPDVTVDGLVDAGTLLTFRADEAVEWGYAEAVVDDRAAALATAGLADAEVVEVPVSLAESAVRVVTHPVTAALLMIAGVLLVVSDLLTGGIGLGTVLGAPLFVLFFWGHLLAGLAGWEDVALVVLGLVLIAVELLVVPGVGIPGLLGLAALLGGLFLAMTSREFTTPEQLRETVVTVSAIFLGVLLGLVLLLRRLSRRGAPRSLVLDAKVGRHEPVTQRGSSGWLGWLGNSGLVLTGRDEADRHAASQGPVPAAPEETPAGQAPAAPEQTPVGQAPGEAAGEPPVLVGRHGRALSDLRPAGIAEIDGERVDVVTAGDYIDRGQAVEVVRDDGYRRVVRRVDSDSTGDSARPS